MLLRMYLRYAARSGLDSEVLSLTAGKGGVRHAVIHLRAPLAYGAVAAEDGVHRMMRRSPFDACGRRHTSFVAVCVRRDTASAANGDLDLRDVRVDTDRGSGPGGQHRNRRETAVRMVHLPTGTSVRVQTGRSQHRNRALAERLLRSKLEDTAQARSDALRSQARDARPAAGFGTRIRSYRLDEGIVRDELTGRVSRRLADMLDGDLEVLRR